MHLYRATVLACLAFGAAFGQGLTITTPATLLPASSAVNYSYQFTAAGGTPPYTWTAIAGALPTCCGLTLSPAGVLAGRPSQIPGSGTFTVRVNDSAGNSATQNFSLSIYPAAGSLLRSAVLSQVAAGGGWDTTIFLINTSSTTVNSASVLFRFNQSGQPWSLPVTTQQLGYTLTPAASELDFVLPPSSSVIIQTSAPPSAALQQGWADVLTTSNPNSGTVGAYAIFRQTFPNGSTSVGTSGGTGAFESSVAVPYDNSTAQNTITGVALVSLSSATININATAYDQNGNALSTQLLNAFAPMSQITFQVPTLMPQTAGQRGVIILNNTSNSDSITGLGLRFAGNSFTSVPTINP